MFCYNQKQRSLITHTTTSFTTVGICEQLSGKCEQNYYEQQQKSLIENSNILIANIKRARSTLDGAVRSDEIPLFVTALPRLITHRIHMVLTGRN